MRTKNQYYKKKEKKTRSRRRIRRIHRRRRRRKTTKLTEKDDDQDANLKTILAAKEAQRAAERRVGLSGVPFAEFTRKSRVDWSLVPKDLSERRSECKLYATASKAIF